MNDITFKVEKDNYNPKRVEYDFTEINKEKDEYELDTYSVRYCDVMYRYEFSKKTFFDTINEVKKYIKSKYPKRNVKFKRTIVI